MVQVASPPGEPVAERRARVNELVEGALGADLVVLPELWGPGYFAFDRYGELAEMADGETVRLARAWSQSLGCAVVPGSFVERAEDGQLFNTTVVVGADGSVETTYRKVHVFGYGSREAELVSPGTDVTAIGTKLGSLGVSICYDLRFPELYRQLVDRGAEILVVPAAWPAARLAHWQLLTSARAVENQCAVVAVNATGIQFGDVVLAGHSRVVGPWGDVLAEAGTDEGITVVDLDVDAVTQCRAEFPALADRRMPVAAAAENPASPDHWRNRSVGGSSPGVAYGKVLARRRSGVLRFTVAGSGEVVTAPFAALVIGGYTGRDAVAVQAHIDELAAIGVPPPPTVPTFYLLDAALLTTDTAVKVDSADTSGEVEPVLLRLDGVWYLGVGSDHTDRLLERSDVAAAKAACPKPLGSTLARLGSDLAVEWWDEVTAVSRADGRLYQRGSLAALRHPADLFDRFVADHGDVEGNLALFGGTLPLIDGEFASAKQWDLELHVPGVGLIGHSYMTTDRST